MSRRYAPAEADAGSRGSAKRAHKEERRSYLWTMGYKRIVDMGSLEEGQSSPRTRGEGPVRGAAGVTQRIDGATVPAITPTVAQTPTPTQTATPAVALRRAVIAVTVQPAGTEL